MLESGSDKVKVWSLTFESENVKVRKKVWKLKYECESGKVIL